MDAHFKAKWLRWWNSTVEVKEANHFPSAIPLREKVLESWLNRASFWAQVLIQLSSHFVFSSQYFLFLTALLSYNSWRRGSRPKSRHLKMNTPLTSIGDLLRTFYNPPIMLSIGGSYCGTRLSVCISTTKGSSNLLRALILWSLMKAPWPSNAWLTGNLFIFHFIYIVFISFQP